MINLNSHTGYVIIDHKDSPGISESELPERLRRNGAVAVRAGQTFERDTKVCTHCQRGIILNPGRVRDRGICYHCHHYICDSCDTIYRKTGLCVPFKKVLDDMANLLEKQNPTEPLIQLTDI